MHTSSTVGGCYIVVARLSVEGPLSNRFDDGWRASAHCNAVTCPRTKIFTNYRVKMEIARREKDEEKRDRRTSSLFYGIIGSVLCPSISRRWQFRTLRDLSLHSAIRVLIKHLIFRLVQTVLSFLLPSFDSSDFLIARFARITISTTKFSRSTDIIGRVKISARKLNPTMLAMDRANSDRHSFISPYNYPVIHRVGPP